MDSIAALLSDGAAAIVPTDTVYGLVCRADRPDAIARVFALKGRPRREPLILLIAAAAQMSEYAAEVPPAAQRLAAAGWPGPLTIVVRASGTVSPAILGDGDTVGLRVPDHAALLAILRRVGVALASTSANRHGEQPPADAASALAALVASPDFIVDAGPARHGVPSTVVDCTVTPPRVVRAGALTESRIRELLDTP